MYLTLDTETVGGANKPKGFYHLGGIVHDRSGNIYGCFNLLVMEWYDEIKNDDYAKKNFYKYAEMVKSGEVTIVPTEKDAIALVNAICEYYGVDYLMAFNSGFDYVKTKCKELLEGRQFIDIWLMALQTLAPKKDYQRFCHENELKSRNGKSIATSAESFYAYLTQNADYAEEHTALEDSKIEMQIFLACLRTHKAFTKNTHTFDFENRFQLFPKW